MIYRITTLQFTMVPDAMANYTFQTIIYLVLKIKTVQPRQKKTKQPSLRRQI